MRDELDDSDKVLLRRSLERMQSANEIVRFVSDYFRDKYGLKPQHQVTPDGRIIRIQEQQTDDSTEHAGVRTDGHSDPVGVGS